MGNGNRLRDLIERPQVTVVPGVGTALEARLVEQTGFEAVYMSGYATAAAVYGYPDIGIIAAGEIIANAQTIRLATSLPLIVDADTGYGDVANVRATVRRLAAIGVDAVQIEDQVWPKRCGHMEGKEVESATVMERKIVAARLARSDDGPLIVARTDSRATHGLDEAIERTRRYVEAGADVAFIDAPESRSELEQIGSANVGAPLMVNISETGKTPMLPAKELEDLGFALVVYPSSAVRVVADVLGRFYLDLHRQGDSSGWQEAMMALDRLNVAVGIEDEEKLESAVLEIVGGTS